MESKKFFFIKKEIKFCQFEKRSYLCSTKKVNGI